MAHLTFEFRLAQHLRPISDPRERIVFRMGLARVSTAVLGAGTVVFAALAAHALFGGPVGLIAGLLLALSPLHVHLAHIAINDVPASFFLAASLAASVVSLRKPMVLFPITAR